MTRRALASLPSWVIIALLSLACGDDGGEWVGVATIYGRVVGTDGSGVAGVMLQAATSPAGACSGAMIGGIGGPAVPSDNAGYYRIDMGGFGIDGPFCVRVVASPPHQSGLGGDSATVPNVRIGRDGGDSVRLDFLLRPAA